MDKHDVTPLMEVLTCKCGKLFESTNRNGLLCRPCALRLIKASLDKMDDEMIERIKNQEIE